MLSPAADNPLCVMFVFLPSCVLVILLVQLLSSFRLGSHFVHYSVSRRFLGYRFVVAFQFRHLLAPSVGLSSFVCLIVVYTRDYSHACG
jgi:hypothetical protein